jgi:RNA polymerase sigma-70 factor, ECF subfamily
VAGPLPDATGLQTRDAAPGSPASSVGPAAYVWEGPGVSPGRTLPPRGVAAAPAPEDSALARQLAGCAAGNRQDLERLYRATAPRLLGRLVALLGDRALAEDALQEVYIKVWERARQFDLERGRPLTWLLSIARNHALDLIRARRHRSTLDVDALDLADDSPGPAGQESDATAQLLARCLQGLSDAQRRSLHLAYAGGLAQEQIAVVLQSPLGSVKSWIRRALRQLRECMEP